MAYEDMNLPDFMKEPQKAAKAVFADDGFDPSPYERILNASMTGQTLFGMHPLEQQTVEEAKKPSTGEKTLYGPARGSHMEVSREMRMGSAEEADVKPENAGVLVAAAAPTPPMGENRSGEWPAAPTQPMGENRSGEWPVAPTPPMGENRSGEWPAAPTQLMGENRSGEWPVAPAQPMSENRSGERPVAPIQPMSENRSEEWPAAPAQPTAEVRLTAEEPKDAGRLIAAAEETDIPAAQSIATAQPITEARTAAEKLEDVGVLVAAAAPAQPAAAVETTQPQPTAEAQMAAAPADAGMLVAAAAPAAAAPSITKRESPCIIPLAGTVIYDQLKLNDVKEKQGTRIFIEEDILVPDIRPDLATILLMTGTARLDNKEFKAGTNGEDFLKITGEVALQTLYIPEAGARSEPLITIQSVVPFKADWTVNVSPLSQLVIKPVVESVDFTVINERKFRAKLTVYLTMKEYEDVEIQLFEGIKGEELQTLREQIRLTGIAARKTETLDLCEELVLKEGALKPERILKYDINVAESHKQVGKDKAIVNAVVYCNVLYLGRSDEDELVPQLYQGKTEFAQFMPLDGVDDLAGSKATFNSAPLAVRIKNNEEDGSSRLELEGTVDTTLEVYKTLEKEIVSDVYHSQKDIVYDYSELAGANLCGSGVSEISTREIFNVPSKYPDVEKIIYITGRLKRSSSILEQGKNIVEGVMEITLLCVGEDDAHTMFKLVQELPFRGAMDIPGARPGMKAANDIAAKELWFDKINGRQVEVNAGIMVSSAVFSQDTYHLIKNVCFLDQPQEEGRKACMIIYNAREGDNLWKIAKKYRTTIGCLQKINNLEQNAQVQPGSRLLIVY